MQLISRPEGESFFHKLLHINQVPRLKQLLLGVISIHDDLFIRANNSMVCNYSSPVVSLLKIRAIDWISV